MLTLLSLSHFFPLPAKKKKIWTENSNSIQFNSIRVYIRQHKCENAINNTTQILSLPSLSLFFPYRSKPQYSHCHLFHLSSYFNSQGLHRKKPMRKSKYQNTNPAISLPFLPLPLLRTLHQKFYRLNSPKLTLPSLSPPLPLLRAPPQRTML